MIKKTFNVATLEKQKTLGNDLRKILKITRRAAIPKKTIAAAFQVSPRAPENADRDVLTQFYSWCKQNRFETKDSGEFIYVYRWSR